MERFHDFTLQTSDNVTFNFFRHKNFSRIFWTVTVHHFPPILSDIPLFREWQRDQRWSISYRLYAFFWVIPQRLNFVCQNFRTLCLFHLHRVGTYMPMKMEQTTCSEMLAYKIQMPENYPPKKSIQHSEHGKNLKSRIFHSCLIHSHYARTCEFTYKIYPLLQ